MQLIFIRHGKSIDDTNGVSQRNESPLSEAGLVAAKVRANDFQNISPAVCYVSNYTRAQQTAEALFPNITATTRNDIFEIKRPELLDGGNHADAVHFWEVTHKEDKYLPDWSLDNSESFNDVTARARTFLAEMTEKHRDDSHPIIAVSHGGFIRHCIGIACKGDNYQPADFFELLLPMQIDNLDAIELTIRQNKRPAWRILSRTASHQ